MKAGQGAKIHHPEAPFMFDLKRGESIQITDEFLLKTALCADMEKIPKLGLVDLVSRYPETGAGT